MFDDVHMEQTYKGNYHLHFNVDGKARKFVIAKNKEEYAMIEREGIRNLTSDHLKRLIEKFLAR